MEDVVVRLRAAGCVFAEDEARILGDAASSPAELETLVAQRVSGIPLEHVVGWVDWGGLRLEIDRGVFVPRQRTLALAGEALALTPQRGVVVDLCTGCGAVAAYIHAALPDVELVGSDIDASAVSCARRNLPGSAMVLEGDLFSALPDSVRGRVDVLVANVPYVPTAAIQLLPPEARDHEPLRALDGGPDGLDVARRVVAGAVSWLAPPGHLLIEVGQDQVDALVLAMTDALLYARVAPDDELGTAVVIGSRRA